MALNYYNKALENGETNHEHYWFQTQQQRTLLMIRNNRGHENLSILFDWLENEPQERKPYISVAFAYNEMGEYDKAYEYIKKAEEFGGDNLTQLTVAGDICRRLKKYNEAILYFDKAYLVDTGVCACLYSKAFTLEEMGEKQKAIEAWEYVIDWHIREGFDYFAVLTRSIN